MYEYLAYTNAIAIQPITLINKCVSLLFCQDFENRSKLKLLFSDLFFHTQTHSELARRYDSKDGHEQEVQSKTNPLRKCLSLGGSFLSHCFISTMFILSDLVNGNKGDRRDNNKIYQIYDQSIRSILAPCM